MNILVINCGSSSIKAEVIDTVHGGHLFEMQITRIGDDRPVLTFSDETEPRDCPGPGHKAVLSYSLMLLERKIGSIVLGGVGHRVVHGGEYFSQPVLITPGVERKIDALSELAPLHNPVNLIGIEAARIAWPYLPHIAVFDTAFHHTLPHRAQAYALPSELAQQHGIRRYGFHGTSHQYVSQQAAAHLGFEPRDLRIITCHLGNGCSVCAVEYGRSVETSMGMSPLEGLVMGTRSGDVDPGVLIHLMRSEGLDAQGLDQLLNRESGLKGLSGIGNDLRDIEARAAEGDDRCRLAIQVFSHRLRKYIGAYAAVMGGVDAIVFTGGIGENSAMIRERAAQRLEFLGALLDEDANRDADTDDKRAIADISRPNSRCKLLVIPTDEQYEIARQTAFIVQKQHQVKETQPLIPIAVSARHVHLTQEVVEALFGDGYQLTEFKPLSQPGQFAANECVSLIGPKNRIDKVRVLGPVRSASQVEISRTDEFFLGIDAPVRASGQVANSPGIKLIGPKGEYTLREGVICAWRHIHMTPEDAAQFGVADKDVVSVEVENQERSLTFGNVLVRVSPDYRLEMHIDTDEANAAELGRTATGVLFGTGKNAGLVKRNQA